MTTAHCDDWEILPGSTEYRHFEVESSVTIDTQVVEVSVDHQATWITAEWVGAAAETREGRVLLAHSQFPQNRNPVTVWIRVTDNPETIIIDAGNAYVH